MSFNYLEIERALSEIHRSANEGAEDFLVRSIEFVEFPLFKKTELRTSSAVVLEDVCLAFRLADYSLVFSLKHPWVGLFWMRHPAFRKIKQTSMAGFSLSQFDSLKGQRIDLLEQVSGDRVVKLHFSSGAQLEVELFGMRPNWKLTGPINSQWRPDSAQQNSTQRALRDAGPKIQKNFEIRDFGALHNTTIWLEGAYYEYRALRRTAYLRALRGWAAGELEKRLTHLLKVRGAMQEQLRETREGDRLRKAGEELKAVLYQHPPAFKTSHLPGFAYELDAEKTLAENADLFFDRSKKLVRTSKEVTKRLQEIESRVERQRKLIQRLRDQSLSTTNSQLPQNFDLEVTKISEFLVEAGLDNQVDKKLDGREFKQKEKMIAAGARQFRSRDGQMIWVGRNQDENEKIVIRVANGNDIWMHLKGRPGAHVIVQIARGKSASLETLLDAAALVCHYSGIGEQEKAEVDYTFRKYVKRLSGAKFAVTYSQNKTLVVKQDADRLKRLLAQDY